MYLPSMIRNSDASILFLIQMQRLELAIRSTLEITLLHDSKFKIVSSEASWLLASSKHIVALQNIRNGPLI